VSVHVNIVDGPITQDQRGGLLHDDSGEVGAALRFDGIVRTTENGRALLALEYQTYDPMTQRELESLARDVASRHGLRSVSVFHSRGRVPVGAVSFVLHVVAPHRAEALAGLAEFIDLMKRDVPIWKTPVWLSEPSPVARGGSPRLSR
jgi:molybdopterin synthase catalytic subunit